MVATPLLIVTISATVELECGIRSAQCVNQILPDIGADIGVMDIRVTHYLALRLNRTKHWWSGKDSD